MINSALKLLGVPDTRLTGLWKELFTPRELQGVREWAEENVYSC